MCFEISVYVLFYAALAYLIKNYFFSDFLFRVVRNILLGNINY